MKISNKNGFETLPISLNEVSAVNKITKAQETKTVAPAAPIQDTVSISDDVKFCAIAKAEAMNVSEVRAEKVARLKAMVANGTYEFNSMDTARAMVKDIFASKSLLLVN